MIEWLIESLRHVRAKLPVVLATSSESSDDPIAVACVGLGIQCHRGPLDDVAARFLQVLDTRVWSGFVRVCGDSPLLVGSLIDQAVDRFRAGAFDLVTNVQVRSYPKGQSVEVVDAGAFRRALAAGLDPQDREHVTRYFYRRPEEFRIENLSREPGASETQLSVDTAQDFQVIEGIVRRMTRPHWSYDVDELLDLHAAVTGGAS